MKFSNLYRFVKILILIFINENSYRHAQRRASS